MWRSQTNFPRLHFDRFAFGTYQKRMSPPLHLWIERGTWRGKKMWSPLRTKRAKANSFGKSLFSLSFCLIHLRKNSSYFTTFLQHSRVWVRRPIKNQPWGIKGPKSGGRKCLASREIIPSPWIIYLRLFVMSPGAFRHFSRISGESANVNTRKEGEERHPSCQRRANLVLASEPSVIFNGEIWYIEKTRPWRFVKLWGSLPLASVTLKVALLLISLTPPSENEMFQSCDERPCQEIVTVSLVWLIEKC